MAGFEVVEGDHVADLLHRRVDDEDAADEEDDGGEVEFALEDPRELQVEKRLLEAVEERQNDEEQHQAQRDGHQDADLADARLLVGGGALRLDGDVEEIVETEDGLEEDQDAEVDEVLQREEVGHGAKPSRTLASRGPSALQREA